MRIGVIIPDRSDRPQFLRQCLEMIAKQTMQPTHIELINYEPKSKETDLTARVRLGWEQLKDKCDCVLIMENDDWYSPVYIETMVNQWVSSGRPNIFGTSETIYYHIFKRQYKILNHPTRASLMNTLLSCSIDIDFPKDSEVFLDIELWKKIRGKTFKPLKPISVGIKHGVGLCGGNGHEEMILENEDQNGNYLKSIIGDTRFYNSINESGDLLKKTNGKIKLAIVTGIWNRKEVFEMFAKGIENLVKKCPQFEFTVIVSGSEGVISKNIVGDSLLNKGAKILYIEMPNEPLATKMSSTTRACRGLDIDYVLCVGSDDIISPELLNEYAKSMRQGIDFIGVTDCYFYDTISGKSLYWGGYREPFRQGQTCGAFRALSKRLISLLDYSPWEDQFSKGLDTSMQMKLKSTRHSSHVFAMRDKGLFALDIKSSTNMTPFMKWDNSEFIDTQIIKNQFNFLF